MDLAVFVEHFAAAMQTVDARRPVARSQRSQRAYLPGIGPHPEDLAVDLTVVEMRLEWPELYSCLRTQVPYPLVRQKCDLVVGDPAEWAIEVKMARPNGDNGKPDDTSIKDILSPYDSDRSAVADARKLSAIRLAEKTAIIIYGFEDVHRPLLQIIDAFETLASQRVQLGDRLCADLGRLVHPVHCAGKVFAWEVFRCA